MYTVAPALEIATFSDDYDNGLPKMTTTRLVVSTAVPFAVLPAVVPEAEDPAFPLVLVFTVPGGKTVAADLAVRLRTPLAEGQQVGLYVGGLELIGRADAAVEDGKTVVRWRASHPAGVRRAFDQLPDDGRFLRVQVDGIDSSPLTESADGEQPTAPFADALKVTSAVQ